MYNLYIIHIPYLKFICSTAKPTLIHAILCSSIHRKVQIVQYSILYMYTDKKMGKIFLIFIIIRKFGIRCMLCQMRLLHVTHAHATTVCVKKMYF